MESEITGFNGRETGLFIPYWLAYLFSDGLKQGKQGKACFGHPMNTPFYLRSLKCEKRLLFWDSHHIVAFDTNNNKWEGGAADEDMDNKKNLCRNHKFSTMSLWYCR